MGHFLAPANGRHDATLQRRESHAAIGSMLQAGRLGFLSPTMTPKALRIDKIRARGDRDKITSQAFRRGYVGAWKL